MSASEEIVPKPTISEEGIRSRIEAYLTRHTKAEVARKTGTSAANVGRYARGIRIPAQFCAALVHNMGVNATWLLTGEGSPTVMEGEELLGETAADILDLVRSMDAAIRMPIGSISGSSYANSLRLLSSALERHNELQVKLNKVASAQFSQLLKDLSRSIHELELDRAKQIRSAALRLRDICSDKDLNLEFSSHQAHLEIRLGNTTLALEYFQEVVQHHIVNHTFPSDSSLIVFARLLLIVSTQGYMKKALRIVESLEKLAGSEFKNSNGFYFLLYISGRWQIDLGQLETGILDLHRSIPFLSGIQKKKAKSDLSYALLLSNNLTVQEVLDIRPSYIGKVNTCLKVALYNEDVIELEAALTARFSGDVTRAYDETPETSAAKILLKALKSEPMPSQYFLVQDNSVSEPYYEFYLEVLRSKISLCYGDRKNATIETLHADELFLGLSDDVTTCIVFRAMHYKNVVRLRLGKIKSELQARADRFFETTARDGYILFSSRRRNEDII